ncbi:MAG: hypothetical protein U0892_04650 [Pirellulales bacterium]
MRLVVSLLLVIHLTALLGEPLAMFSRGREPASPDASLIRRSLAPYIDFAYLSHGYFFFAPNPGPSHLIDIRIVDQEGFSKHLRLPNRQGQWPRLLYHRHFMLAEFLNQLYAPPAAPVEVNEMAVRAAWQRDRSIFERVRGSMERRLKVQYNAASVEIRLVEHRLPAAGEVFERGLKLNDESTYLILSETGQGAAETILPPTTGSVAPPVVRVPLPYSVDGRTSSSQETVPATPAEGRRSEAPR